MNEALRERALRLLARRDHTRLELARKLAGVGDSTKPVDVLLDELAAQGLLSDERYVLARLHNRSKVLGNARLANELRAKGVADELVRAALSSTEDEFVRARRIWQRKFGEFPTTAAQYAKQARFLAARGFAGETIRRVLNSTLEND